MARKVMQRNYDSEGKLVSKECSKCHKIKSVSEFNKDNSKKDDISSACKECKSKHAKEYYKNNSENIKEKTKKYYINNIEQCKECRRKNYQNNREHYKELNKKNYIANKEHYKEYKSQYYIDNKVDISKRKSQYYYKNKEYFNKKGKENYNQKIQEALQQIKMEVEADPNKYNYIEGKEIFGTIYLVHNTESDKYYVGQTTVGFDNRYPKGWLAKHSYKNNVKEDLELYGEESFEYAKILKVAHSQYELDKLEAYYINYYDSYEKGYNENRGNIFTDRGKEK